MNRPITKEDLEDKGYPFECLNCGNKPTPQKVIEMGGICECCNESVVAYTVDTAEFILAQTPNDPRSAHDEPAANPKQLRQF